MNSLTQGTRAAFDLKVCFPCVSGSTPGYKLLNVATWTLKFKSWSLVNGHPPMYVVGLLVVSEEVGTSRDLVLAHIEC